MTNPTPAPELAQVAGPTAPQLATASDARRSTGALLQSVWKEHRALLAIIALYAIGSTAYWRSRGWTPPGYGVMSFLAMGYLPVVLAVPYLFVLRRRAERAGAVGWRAGWSEAWREARRTIFTPERLLGAAIVLAVYPVLATTFTYWKEHIPLLHPFTWDARLAAADRWLLGGRDAWRLTHAAFGAEWPTRAIDALYLPTWALLQFSLWPVVAIAPPGAFRRRFLLSYLLMWMLGGTLLAILFASVGPCFLGVVAGTAAEARPFAPLMHKLAELDRSLRLTAVMGQQYLLENNGKVGRIGAGISAFPSLHVASAVLLALAARHLSRRWARVAAVYAAIVVVGSVHLGWHYLVDGIGGAAVAALVWWTVGLAVGHRPRRP